MPSQVCSQCSHVNPGDASYCYYDGVRLAGGAGGGPLNAGAQDFPTQFVFPSGLVCRNFDQFATTCQSNWPAAVELLKGGMLSSFFGGMGRTDLAMAAQEAARFPDLDRGLDQFLAKLPTQTLQNPKLKVEPSEINLGQSGIGTDRTLDLHLSNAGMRLLYGSIASDSKWLTFGNAPGSQQKLFQFGAEETIPVQVRGQHLRASPKPLEAQLLIESSGGSQTVTVRVTVPIMPFKEGVLAGSYSPRDIAVKAKAHPAEAAPYFEKGAIAQWFKSNGWIYPVQGPSAVGFGAVQQFFEALGLAKAPKVEVSAHSLSLKGDPGHSVSATLDVTTQEKKPVYAHATCEQPWVDVSKVKLAGRTATITVSVPEIPNRPGETLQTKININGNGNQRFTVPLSLAVGGTIASARPPTPPVPPSSSNPFAFTSPGDGVVAKPIPAMAPPRDRDRDRDRDKDRDKDAPDIAKPRKETSALLFHGIPLGVLLFFLFAFLVRDFFAKPPVDQTGGDDTPVEARPRIIVLFNRKELDDPKLPERYQVPASSNLTFGVLLVVNESSDQKAKLLFYAPRGSTNNTLLKINDDASTFGQQGSGEWVKPPEFTKWDKKSGIPASFQKEGEGTWKVNDIYVTQRVRVIPGQSVEVKPDVFKRFYDSCEVCYRIENKGPKAKLFGMRVMLDTFIGDNDGVPFTVPGEAGLLYKKEFKPAKEVPDFIMALEKEDLKDPGVVAQLNLRHAALDRKLEPPDRVLLTRWPGVAEGDKKGRLDEWDVPLADPKSAKDSAVVLYWSQKTLEPGETRDLGYSYGLSSAGEGQITLTIGGKFVVDREISVIALVNNAKKDETITLTLPDGLVLAPGSGELKQPVPVPDGARPKPVTWKLKATKSGKMPLRAQSSSGASQSRRIFIREKGIFD